MSRMQLSAPDGSVVQNPEIGLLGDMVLRQGSEFWNIGSGDASLEFVTDKERTALHLVFHESHGFFLTHVAYRGGRKRRVSVSGNDYTTIVELWVGGNKLLLPAAVFISRKLAWEGIQDFSQTGLPSTALVWIEERDVKWPEQS